MIKRIYLQICKQKKTFFSLIPHYILQYSLQFMSCYINYTIWYFKGILDEKMP